MIDKLICQSKNVKSDRQISYIQRFPEHEATRKWMK